MSEVVSVIIPVYNVEKYVGKCLDSIKIQTYTNLQIIIVDDGCKDDSVKICEKYAEQDKRMLIVHKENGGLSSARNEGLKYATGKYCYFFDSDDYIEPDTIEVAVREMQENHAQLVAFNRDKVSEDGHQLSAGRVGNNQYEIHSEKDRMIFYLKVYYAYDICFEMWNKLYDLDIIREHQLYFENNYEVFAEDVCFNSYYLLYVNKVVSIDRVFYHYLVREDSIMGVEQKKLKLKNFFCLLSRIETFFQTHASDYMKEHFYLMVPVFMQGKYADLIYYKLPELLSKVQPSPEYDYYQSKLQEVMQHKKETSDFFHEYLEDGYKKPDRMMRNTEMLSLQDHPFRQKLFIMNQMRKSILKNKSKI